MRDKLFALLIPCLAVALSARTSCAQTPQTMPSPTPRPPVLQGVTTGDKAQTTAPAEKLPREVSEDEVLTVNTSLVSIPVSVVDAGGRYVTDLKREEFRVFEDGVEQRVAFFSEVTQPTFVVLLLDVSTSVIWHLREIQEAAVAFTEQLRETDYVFPVAFSGKVIPLLPQATNDRAALAQAIRRTRAVNDDATSLYDAVQTVSDEILKRFRGRKALILFTDGEDVSSRRAKKKDNLRDALELDALIYTVQYPREIRVAKRNYLSVFSPGHQEYLRTLAENTGGRYFKGDKPEKIREAFAATADELRRQYVVGYYPATPLRAGQSRRVKVSVNHPDLTTRTRKTVISAR
jgi:Ca-activated chloride channel family protein